RHPEAQRTAAVGTHPAHGAGHPRIADDLALSGPASAAPALGRPDHRQRGRAARVHAGKPGPAGHRLHHKLALLRTADHQARRDRARAPALTQCVPLIMEGEGAYTTVEGERVAMRPADFV